MSRTIAALAVAAVVGGMFPCSAQAGHGNALNAGFLGFGVGAIVGSALTPREVYVVPPPPPPTYYSPAGYGPPPWSPGWYGYCRNLHGPHFNPNTGYFQSADGGWYFCQ